MSKEFRSFAPRFKKTVAVFFSSITLIGVISPEHTVRAEGPGEEWAQFRGPNGTGVSASKGLPVEFGPTKNVV